MSREYEVIHHFQSETDKEISDHLYQILLEYKEHFETIHKIEREEEIANDHGRPLY